MLHSLLHSTETHLFLLSLSQNIMKQLVEAATQMQSAGVFHRDIKSENVLVETGSDDPRVRVIDFGCGCFERKTPYRCYSGTTSGFCFYSDRWSDDFHLNLPPHHPSVCLCIVGTSAYAPPEFYIQGTYEAGPTTVWQLGALLYEILDGYEQFITSKFLRKKTKFISDLKLLKVTQGMTMLVSIQSLSFATDSVQSFFLPP